MSRGGNQGTNDGVVARGKIRVDARRAVEKLREHLLVDLHLYTLEIARAAVLGGATRIDVEHDADDVRLTFDGERLDEATLTRLLDHVLVEALTKEARRKRLLATGVNAALGLSPAYVDIFTPADAPDPSAKGAAGAAGAARSCLRVRWTPELLAPKDTDEPAKAPTCERVPAPRGMPESGVRIEVRRRIGWNVVRNAIAGGTPQEIALLAGATHEIDVPMTLAGKPFPRPARAPALVRAPFSVRGAERSAVEIIAPLRSHPEIELLEHGVCLTRYAWSFGSWFPSEPLDKVSLPVRVIVDGDELPTNASRSEIQKDAPLLTLVTQAAKHAFDDAVATLLAAVTGRGEAAPATEILTKDKEALEDVLGALVCVAAKAARTGVALSDKAKALLNVPLLRDAHGQPLAPAALLERAPAKLYTWREREPLPQDFAPWTGDVVWLRGRLAEAIFELYDTADAQRIVEQAKIGIERRRAFLAHAATEVAVPPLEDEIVRQSFACTGGEFKGIHGEVVVVPESAERPGTVVRVFVEGRQLDTIDVDAETIPLRLFIAVSWEGRIRARYTYDGVERDQWLQRAIWYATRTAIEAIDLTAKRLKAKSPDEILRGIFRAAIATHLLSPQRLGLDESLREPSISSRRWLHTAPIWPTTEADRWESVSRLEGVLASTGAVCTARYGTQGRAADGRPVIALKDRELGWLTAALAPKPNFVPYTGWLLSPHDLEAREAQRPSLLRATIEEEAIERATVMEWSRPGVRGLIAVGAAPKLVLLHAGKRVSGPEITPSLGPVVVVADDDTLLPGDGPAAAKPAAVLGFLRDIERQLCETTVAAVEDALSRSPNSPDIDPRRLSPRVRVYFFDAAQELRKRAEQSNAKPEDKALFDRVRALPLLVMLDERGAPIAASLADLERAHPAPKSVPYLLRPPHFETLDWRPVIISSEEPTWVAFHRWTTGRAAIGDGELATRKEQALLAARKRALLTNPVLDLDKVGDLAEADARVTCISWKTYALPMGVTVAAALPRSYIAPPLGGSDLISGAALGHAWADVLYQGRLIGRYPLTTLQIPVVARVNVLDESYFRDFTAPSAKGESLIAAHVRMAAIALASDLLQAATGPAKGDLLFGDLRTLRLLHAVFAGSTRDESIGDKLRNEDFLWPTVQGEWLPFSAMRVATGALGPELYTGSVRHVPWLGPARGKSDLDAPILHLPSTQEGSVLALILQAMGVRTRLVDEALAKLQARRAASRPGEAPTLAGMPPHPDLRMSLTDGGVQTAEGELELIEGPAPDVQIIGLDGASISITEGLPFPLRVVARVESIDLRPEMMKGLIKEISRAAVRRVLSLSQKLDEVPLFVRDHIRRVVCKSVASRSKVAARQMKAPVFLDIAGVWHALADLKQDPGATLNFTTDPPPYPKRKVGEPVLRLSKDEATALSQLGKTHDMTALLRRDRIAEERATAAPASSIALDPELRAKCARVLVVREGSVTGEVGILGPQHQAARGINLFVTGRPLCLIDDGPGWGLCAAVNDDTIKPNRWFDGVKSSAASQQIQRVVRGVAMSAMREALAAPRDALAEQWIDGADAPNSDKPLAILGTFWLPKEWPVDPFVLALREHGAPPARQSVIAGGAVTLVRRHVPICGQIYADPQIPWAMIERIALREAELMIAALDPLTEDRASIEAYQWNMGLLGLTSSRVPRVRTADGGEVGLAEVTGELVTRSCLWVTRREGSIDGAFPGSTPAFVLVDDRSPLLHVLRHRAPPSAIRELGAVEIPHAAAPPAAAPPLDQRPEPLVLVAPEPTRPLYFRDVLETDAQTIATMGSPAGPGPGPPGNGSALVAHTTNPSAPALPWLERLRRRIALLFTSSPAATFDPRVNEQNALCAALHQALGELGLVGGPVYEILEVKRGPAVRYDMENKRVLLNRRHRSLKWLRSSEAPSAQALSYLIAAIVSEINRALTSVTDAEERRVLLQLLRTGIVTPGSGGA